MTWWWHLVRMRGFVAQALLYSPDCRGNTFLPERSEKEAKKIGTKSGTNLNSRSAIALRNIFQLCKLIIISALIFAKHLGKLMQFYILGIEKQFSKRKSKI